MVLLRIFAVAALLLLPAGCGNAAGRTVSGMVFLDGLPVTGELLFEPLDTAGRRRGQSVTVVSDNAGCFRASLPFDDSQSSSLLCRIVIRIPRSAQGITSAFRENALPDKVVELRRELVRDTTLTLLLTQ